jgi:nitrite reductase/ring-hydroxylating ferredoxin subunit
MPGEFFDPSQTQLICATHGATFAPDTGFCTGGPCAGQSLEKITLLEENGQIFALFPQAIPMII